MSDDTDHERIARKAYEIWESEGRPHGRDQAHWDQAKEIVALHDSMGDTLLPRDAGAFEPEEPREAVESYGDLPGLADQGRDDLLDTGREPDVTRPGRETHSLGGNAGHVARAPRVPSDGAEAEDADDEVVTPAPKVAAVTPTPSNPTLGVSAPRTLKTAEAPPAAADLPPMATGAGKPPTGPDDARLGTGLQASPAGNGAQVTGRSPPRPDAGPGSVTKGRPLRDRR